MTDKRPLIEHAANISSQSGEDGIIAELFRRIGRTNGWVVEFGAWDGEVASNSAALVAAGWSAVLIEGSLARHAALERKYSDRTDVVTLGAMVGWSGPNTLDALLSPTPVPRDFDLLSIDIDGNDFHVWKALEMYRPRVVVIEFNPTIPNGIDFVQPADPAVNQGSSVDALVRLGSSKGYELAAVTDFNAFFVLTELLDEVGVDDNSIPALRTDTSWQTQIFFGFDGRAFLRGKRSLYWHGAPVPDKVRVVPRALQGFPGNFGPARRSALWVWRLWRHGRFRWGTRRSS